MPSPSSPLVSHAACDRVFLIAGPISEAADVKMAHSVLASLAMADVQPSDEATAATTALTYGTRFKAYHYVLRRQTKTLPLAPRIPRGI